MPNIVPMVKEHMGPKGPIVVAYKDVSEKTGEEQIIYMIKSISRPNQSYNVVKEAGKWFCDCPSFKYRSGVDKEGHCKHIVLVTFLLNENVEIPEI